MNRSLTLIHLIHFVSCLFSCLADHFRAVHALNLIYNFLLIKIIFLKELFILVFY